MQFARRRPAAWERRRSTTNDSVTRNVETGVRALANGFPDGATVNILTAIALALATPYFVIFGCLSDRIGRKPIMTGCALAALIYFPLLDAWSCDIAKAYLAKASVSYDNVAAPAGTVASIRIGDTVIPAVDPRTVSGPQKAAAIAAFQDRTKAALVAVGYPAKADPAQIDKPLVVGLLFVLVLYVTMVYGPIAALLVELFPTRIRYT